PTPGAPPHVPPRPNRHDPPRLPRRVRRACPRPLGRPGVRGGHQHDRPRRGLDPATGPGAGAGPRRLPPVCPGPDRPGPHRGRGRAVDRRAAVPHPYPPGRLERMTTEPPAGHAPEQGTDQPEQPAAPARERPRWSAAEAARRCGVGRATIQRALTAGRIPGAEQTDAGWSIPLEGLLAAGFTPDRYQPHDTEQPEQGTPAREHDRAADEPVPEQARRIAEL